MGTRKLNFPIRLNTFFYITKFNFILRNSENKEFKWYKIILLIIMILLKEIFDKLFFLYKLSCCYNSNNYISIKSLIISYILHHLY